MKKKEATRGKGINNDNAPTKKCFYCQECNDEGLEAKGINLKISADSNNTSTKTYDDFFSIGVEYNGSVFEPVEVMGDGNCFFRSVILDPNVPFDFHLALRLDLVQKMRDEVSKNSEIGKIIKKWWGSEREPYTLFHHLAVMEQSGEWATDLEIVAFQIIYKIRLVALKNKENGFDETLQLRTTFQMLRVPDHEIDNILSQVESGPSIFIYHHYISCPWRIENGHGNHYMYFCPSDLDSFPNPYKGGNRNNIITVSTPVGVVRVEVIVILDLS